MAETTNMDRGLDDIIAEKVDKHTQHRTSQSDIKLIQNNSDPMAPEIAVVVTDVEAAAVNDAVVATVVVTVRTVRTNPVME